MRFVPILMFLFFVSCATYNKNIPVNAGNVEAGSQVSVKGQSVKLYSTQSPIRTGMNLKEFFQSQSIDVELKDQVTVINVVPSIDTPTCEAQTHILGETDKLSPSIDRIVISRDLPMAQSRFAKEAKLTNIRYFSDYKNGNFGKSTGLMMKGKELLARAVIVVDSDGVIRYLQIIPEVSQLPDMDKAFELARSL